LTHSQHTGPVKTLVLALALGAVVPTVRGQAPAELTETRVRALTRQAVREAGRDPTTIVLALDRLVRQQWGDFESFPISIVRNEDMLVTVTAPYAAFRRSVIDGLRTNRPVERAVWTATVDVEVSPRRLGAPDIQSVVLSRGGAAIAPVETRLRPMTFSNGSGAQGVLHAGDVRFSPSAFAPGAEVVLTLTPAQGEPLVYRFSDSELRTLR
jgi:hypothetical protein